MTTDYIESRFGPPAFARAFPWPNKMIALGKPPTRELVYREKHAWLQTVVDQNDAVLRFSITVTDPRFKFQIRDLTFGHLSARLGSSRFAGLECQWATQGRSLRIGAHNREYAEAYYCGNPGNYQTFVVSNNDAAPGEFGYPIERKGHGWVQGGILQFDEPPPAGNPGWDEAASYATRFRAGTTINTLTVLGPSQLGSLLAEPRGPDVNQVRVLVPTPRERRQMRRQGRRVNREMAQAIAQESDSPAPDDSVTR